jgi:hypothetical protein
MKHCSETLNEEFNTPAKIDEGLIDWLKSLWGWIFSSSEKSRKSYINITNSLSKDKSTEDEGKIKIPWKGFTYTFDGDEDDFTKVNDNIKTNATFAWDSEKNIEKFKTRLQDKSYESKILQIIKDRKPFKVADNIDLRLFVTVADANNLTDLTFLDVSVIKNMDRMIGEIKNKLDISNWDVSNCTSFNQTFMKTKQDLDISKWNVSSGLFFIGTFSFSTMSIDLSNWDPYRAQVTASMFENSNINFNIGKWDLSNLVAGFATNMLKVSAMEKNFGTNGEYLFIKANEDDIQSKEKTKKKDENKPGEETKPDDEKKEETKPENNNNNATPEKPDEASTNKQ